MKEQCPVCGRSDGMSFPADQGDKWGRAWCWHCDVKGPEVRTLYDTSDDAPWHIEAMREFRDVMKEHDAWHREVNP